MLDYAEESEEYKKASDIQIAELKQKCAKQENEITEKSTVLEREKSKAEVVSHENEKLELSCKKQQREKDREIEQFKAELEALTEHSKKKISELEETVRSKKEETEQAKKEIEQVSTARGKSERSAAELSNSYSDNHFLILDDKVAELSGTVRNLKETARQEKEKASSEQKKVEQNISLLEKQIKELDLITKKQKEDIIQLTEDNKTAEGKNNEYTQTINYLTTNLAEAQNELEKILEAYEDLNVRHKKLEDEFTESKAVLLDI